MGEEVGVRDLAEPAAGRRLCAPWAPTSRCWAPMRTRFAWAYIHALEVENDFILMAAEHREADFTAYLGRQGGSPDPPRRRGDPPA